MTRLRRAVGLVAACLERGGEVRAWCRADQTEVRAGRVTRGLYAVTGGVRLYSTESLVDAALAFVARTGEHDALTAAKLCAHELEMYRCAG